MGFFVGDVLCILYVSVHKNTYSAANEIREKNKMEKYVNQHRFKNSWVAMDFEWNAITVILDSNFTTV